MAGTRLIGGTALATRLALGGLALGGLAPWGAIWGAVPAVAGETLALPASGQGSTHTPSSGRPVPGDAGRQMRTHVKLFIPEQRVNPDSAALSSYYFETPASLACLYGQTAAPAAAAGCVPAKVRALASGGSRAIAIVDAYDHPAIASDLATYSSYFGLPAASLQVVYANGTRPAQDTSGGWELEAALDVEMAHALAPKAALILVEAASAGTADLLKAVDVASALVAKAGGGEVSMSWGGAEFASEASLDGHFATPNVVYLASSGDAPGVQWPAASANVVGVGGTSVSRSPTTGTLIGEASWSLGGGGPSLYVAQPSYQKALSSLTGAKRATPDLAAVADPDTPVIVYDSIPLEGTVPGWATVGGTSAATPLMAAMINATGTFRASSAAQLAYTYGQAGTASLSKITRGICGPYAGYSPGNLWNPCVGLGTPAGGAAF